MSRVSIHPDLILHILYGSPDGRRYTQDTPVLPDVWLHFGREIGEPLQGLIVPRNDHQAHHVANELQKRIQDFRSSSKKKEMLQRAGANISDMPGLIALSCQFDEVVNVILPLTRWWESDGMNAFVELPESQIAKHATEAFKKLQSIEIDDAAANTYRDLSLRRLARDFKTTTVSNSVEETSYHQLPDSTVRVLLVIALIHAGRLHDNSLAKVGMDIRVGGEPRKLVGTQHLHAISPSDLGKALRDVLRVKFLRNSEIARTRHYGAKTEKSKVKFDSKLIFTLSVNRDGDGAVADSVKTTKADAARRLFALSNGKITWAVIDSGIDARHHAFRDYPSDYVFDENVDWDKLEEDVPQKNSRVQRRYDMTLVSELRNRDILGDDAARKELAKRIQTLVDMPPAGGRNLPALKDIEDLLEEARRDLENGRPLNWDLAEQLTRTRHDLPPSRHHGTHVAGTLGGRWPETKYGETTWVEGMCPDIQLYDFNVIGGSLKATEFAVIAAMRLIRHLNERNDFMVVHGANLSLAIPHDVTNYACGRTPVCVECETLVSNGVVVVAAAGNAGYNVFKTKDRELPLHTETSIADPGNAEAVITVGSTHRMEPHNYGVSYFSSRGPTGDGRMKPDLVAPGEKIDAPICSQQFATLEGTSMAAPHVSGSAALLMARFPELVGNPYRIKQILCDTATDLGRERTYQGCGLVDVLRALQSV